MVDPVDVLIVGAGASGAAVAWRLAGAGIGVLCLEQFGPDRCMFESNFPVDKVSYSYNVVYNAFKRLSKGYSAAERAAMFHDTAARVYRIDH